MSYKDRQQVHQLTRDCFKQADVDRSNTITLFEFYHFLQLVFQRLGLQRAVSQKECEQLFRFYDDNRSGFLTADELTDVVWDIYTSDIQNDRVAYQQLLEKVLVTKLYSRHYQEFDNKKLYGKWGRSNNTGDWKNYRFNDYQLKEMKNLNYDFNNAKKQAELKKQINRLPTQKRIVAMGRLQDNRTKNQQDISDIDDLEDVEDSDSELDYDDSEDEEDIEEEVRGWGKADKKLLKKYSSVYAKKNDKKKKEKYLAKLRKEKKGKFADVIESREKQGKIKQPKILAKTPVGGNRGVKSVRQIELPDPMLLHRCRTKYLKALKKGKTEADNYIEAMRADGFLDIIDILQGRAIATNDPNPNWAAEAGITLGDSNQGGFGGRQAPVQGARRRVVRSIQLPDPMLLHRCRTKYLKALKKGKAEADNYIEAMRSDGFLDIIDILQGRAIATNDPNPNWAAEAGIVFQDFDSGVVVGGVGNQRRRNPRPIELPDPLLLHRCRNRFVKASDKYQYLDDLRRDGYDDIAEILKGKAYATNDPSPQKACTIYDFESDGPQARGGCEDEPMGGVMFEDEAPVPQSSGGGYQGQGFQGQGFQGQGFQGQGFQGGFQGGYQQGGFQQGGYQQGGYQQGGYQDNYQGQPGYQGQGQGGFQGFQGFQGQGGFQGGYQGGNTPQLGGGFSPQMGGMNNYGPQGTMVGYQTQPTVIQNSGPTTIIPGTTPYHRPNQNAPTAFQQSLLDPFSWQTVPQYTTKQEISLPSPSQLTGDEMNISVQNLFQMMQYLQLQQVTFVTPIRSRRLNEQDALRAIQTLPSYVTKKGYGQTIPYVHLFVEFVNLIEGGSY